MFTYHYDHELNVLIMKSTGKINVEDIKGHYIKLPEWSVKIKNLLVLIDAEDTIMELTHEDIKQLFIPLVKAVKSFNTLQEAILVDKPAETAMATLFKIEFTNLDSYSFKIFSTKEAAMNWLKKEKVHAD